MKQIIDMFDNDERIIINKTCRGIALAEFKRGNFLENLMFSRDISTEKDILNLLNGLIFKIEHISDTEWNDLKTKLPLYTYYNAESNVDEVPED